MTDKEETQTLCEYWCHSYVYADLGFGLMVVNYIGQTYWFHEDDPPHYSFFMPVIDSEGFPVTKTVRVDK